MPKPDGAGDRATEFSVVARRPPMTLMLGAGLPAATAGLWGAGSTATALQPDELTMRAAEWAYYNVEEVWSAFNIIAEAVVRGFRATAADPSRQAEVAAWTKRVDVSDQARKWVASALVYGRSVMEVSREELLVHNPRYIEFQRGRRGELLGAWQVLDGERCRIPREKVRVFTLHSMFANDLRGVSAVHPVLRTVEDMMDAREVNRAVTKRYRAPIRIIELPHDATQADQKALARQLKTTPAGMDLVLPPGARIHVLNHGKDLLEPDRLMREHLMDRIFLGLGVPKLAMGIPDGSARNVSEVQREMLLAHKVAPYQRRVKQFAERLYEELFGCEVAVQFDPLDVRDERELAEVTKVLVETGVKTPEEVGEHYWKWMPG